MKFCLGLTCGLLLGFVCLLFYAGYKKKQEKSQLDSLHRMIQLAIEGKFMPNKYDESKVSAIENSMRRYLTDCYISNQNLEEQRAVVQELITDISHQTTTPIANIMLYNQLLREQLDSDTETIELSEAIGEQTEKLDFLIQTLVKLSRLENGIIMVYPKLQKVDVILAAIKQQYEKRMSQKNQELVIEMTEDMEAVFDEKWTMEAVANIVDNAYKYTPEGGKIQIQAKKYEMFVRIDIIDNGIGIAEEEMAQIFSRFYRSPEVSDKPGLGIGLYLCREIIQMQEGYIKVSSVHGTGTTFSIFLPK